MARRDLLTYCQYLDPKYERARHLELLASKLAEVERYIETGGEEGIGRLIVNMPPRHGKSETTSKRWPSYLLSRHPDWHIAIAGYNDTFAADFSGANLSVIRDSGEYKKLFPEIRVHPGSKAVNRWALEGGTLDQPSLIGVGINGSVTGRGFQLLVIDDPIKNRAEADSAVYRDKMKKAYAGTFRTRLEPGGAIVIIVTRWHEDDLVGWLLTEQGQRPGEAEHWHVLNLPAICESKVDPLGRQYGEALWPKRWPVKSLLKIKGVNGDEWESQYQGRPTAPGGKSFLRKWWKGSTNRYSVVDPGYKNLTVGRYISWDTGVDDDVEGAYTVGSVWDLLADYRLALRHVERRQVEFPELPPLIDSEAKRWNYDGKLKGIIIEDKSTGTSSLQTLRASSRWARYLIGFMPSGSKEQRANQAAVWCRNGCILLPMPNVAAPWLHEFEHEIFNFPNSQFKDQTDTLSQVVLYLEHYIAQGWEARGGDIPEYEEYDPLAELEGA